MRVGWCAFGSIVIAAASLCLFDRDARASSPAEVHVTEGDTRIDIAPAVEVAVDDRGVLDPASVATLPSARFRHVGGPHPSFGFTRATLWFRFEVRNDASQVRALVLDVGREWLEHVDLYVVSPTGPRLIGHSGSFVPMRSRPIATEHIALPIVLAPGERARYLLRMQGATPLAFDAQLWDPAAFHEHDAADAVLFGAYYGFLIALAVYGCLLYAALRDRGQLIVGVVLTSWTFGEASAHGHVARLFPFLAGQIEARGPALAFAITAGTAQLWMRILNPIAKGSRRALLDRVARSLIFAVTVTPLFVPSYAALTYVGMIAFASWILFESIVALFRGRRDARYFALAIGAWTFGGMGALGVFFGIFPAYSAIEYGAHIGAVAMGSLFSLLLVGAIRADRERIVALHGETQTLNTALESQLATVEANAKSIDALNAELSYQVAARSRELVDLLAKQNTLAVGRVLEPGEVFEARYRIVRPLGAGAWGVVYEVERTSDARRLALKLVTRASTGPEAARVAREAEIGARVRHPNLVPIVDVGVALGTCPFLVMELVTGGALESRRSSFGDARWAVPLLGQIARGLSALHAAQIVHRDVKPANILIDERDGRLTARVADFGIARPDDRPADPMADTMTPESRRVSPKLTQADALVGTPFYMPPEAASGTAVGAAGDVFAFGVMAYEMLIGAAPYEVAPLILSLAGEKLPPPRRLESVALDEHVKTCLERCVAVDPASRPSIADVEAALAS